MKIKTSLLIISILVIFGSCSKKDNQIITDDNNDGGVTTPYSKYDFYIADKGCDQNDAFTKNFLPINGFEKAENFNVIGNTIYTYGTKKYRFADPKSSSYIPGSNYGGYLSINGIEKYSDLGGISNAVIGLQEAGSDVYFATGRIFLDGGISVDQAKVVDPPSKVYKNGTILYDLSGPFNNWYYKNSGQVVNNYKSLISITGIIVRGSDIYVSGECTNGQNSEQKSYGYWKNGIYTELKKTLNRSLANKFKFLVAENGDIYYGFNTSYGGVHLFRNGIDIISGSLINKGLCDFELLNNDIYSLIQYYENGYRLGIFKNGMLEYSSSISNNYNDFKIQVVGNQIFICGAGIETNDKITVFEYKPSTKSLVKIGSSGKNYSCTYVQVLDFQVKKK